MIVAMYGKLSIVSLLHVHVLIIENIIRSESFHYGQQKSGPKLLVLHSQNYLFGLLS